MSTPRPLLLLGLAVLAGAAFVLAGRRCGAPEGAAARTLVLLTIDTLRRDHVGAFAEPERESGSLTPRLDALARAGTRFLDARSPVPLTLPAHVTMFSGLAPATTGVRLNAYDRLPGPRARGFPLLAERLGAAGWRTGAFVSAQPLAARYGLDQGFQVYDDGLDALSAAGSGSVPERPGTETVARALAFLRAARAEQRVFVWIHIFEPHAPYVRYADDVAAADAIVGRLLDGLEAAGRARDAALLVTSDHGEMLGDLGERTHGFLLGDAVLRVPLILLQPGAAPALRRDPADLADVAPTLAHVAGLDWPTTSAPFAGRNLLTGPAPPERVRVAESLYAHHAFRWAQVVAATGPSGTLVDTGGERLGWLAPAPPGEPQGAWRQALDPPAALGQALAAYRSGERPDRMGASTPAGPYGGAGRVAPFLNDADNGRLPDPYREIVRVPILQQLKAQLLQGRQEPGLLPPGALRKVMEQIERQMAPDVTNPEVHFLHGLACLVGALHEQMTNNIEGATSWLQAAESAFGRAFALGRQDAETLALWAGANAMDHEARALERLAAWTPTVGPDCQLFVLQARLHLALAQKAGAEEVRRRHAAEAEAACLKARETCLSARHKALMTQTCR